MDKLPDLLYLSKEQYLLLLEKTKEIGSRVHDLDTESIGNYLAELSNLVDGAKETDEAINKYFSQGQVEISDQLLQERIELMREVQEVNDSVASKIRAKHAVLKAEYSKIKYSRSGINGYQSMIKKASSFVNKSV